MQSIEPNPINSENKCYSPECNQYRAMVYNRFLQRNLRN